MNTSMLTVWMIKKPELTRALSEYCKEGKSKHNFIRVGRNFFNTKLNCKLSLFILDLEICGFVLWRQGYTTTSVQAFM